jgi:two-component system, OmpR family, sensor kinase
MSLRTTLLAAFAYVLLVAIVALEVPFVLNIDRRVDAEVEAESAGQAQLLATSAGDNLARPEQLRRLAQRSARALGGRVVIVNRQGALLADSAGPGLTDTSYASRPEVAQALAGDTTQGERHSSSLDEDLLFTAVPILRNGRAAGAVRVTQSVDAVDAEVKDDALALIGVGAIALAFGIGVAWLLAGRLSRPLRDLARTAHRVAEGDLDARATATGPREQREVANSFNSMTERLGQVLRAQREFVANASHQLRTPLTGLRLRLEAARAKASDGGVRAELAAAEQEVERLAGLLTNLLTLAREGQSTPDPQPVPLQEAASAARERWAARAREVGQSLHLSGNGQVDALATRADVDIVLDNLLENALHHASTGSAVGIEWTRDGDIAVLAVNDQGPGLSPEQSEYVLERFARGSPETGGSGLGLSIVEALTRRWSGSLRLRNRAENGLRAEVRLPAAGQSLRDPDTQRTKPLRERR